MSDSGPGQRPSDEADANQLRMARAEGDAYQASLAYMIDNVADTGTMRRVGDYVVAIAQERAEGMYHLKGGELAWIEPEGENCHIEVSVSDATDRRFIPGLDITATLTAEGGETVGPVKVPFLWHPGLYHYGVSVRVPGSGRYAISIHIGTPTFCRHDKVNGRRYAQDVDTTFDGVEVKAGRE